MSITRANRFSVVVALAFYTLAATAIHCFHDHSGAGHLCDGHACGMAHHDADSAAASHHEEEKSPCKSGDCEDSCLACRLLALKSIAPAIVAVAERVETFAPLEAPPYVCTPVVRPALPLSRGPPSV
jgi:hypothetical protein